MARDYDIFASKPSGDIAMDAIVPFVRGLDEEFGGAIEVKVERSVMRQVVLLNARHRMYDKAQEFIFHYHQLALLGSHGIRDELEQFLREVLAELFSWRTPTEVWSHRYHRDLWVELP